PSDGCNVQPDETVHDIGNAFGEPLLHFDLDSQGEVDPYQQVSSQAADDLESTVSQLNRPVIVAVDSRFPPHKPFHHYVLVMGVISSGSNGTCGAYMDLSKNCIDFLIDDPAGNPDPTKVPYTPPFTLLSQYGEFNIWGFVDDPQGDNSALDFSVGQSATLLVTDASGRRTGVDPTTGTVVKEIPGSGYFTTAIDDDEVGGPGTGPSNLLDTFQPSPGAFTVVLNGVQTGSYSLSMRAFSPDGSSQPPVVLQGATAPGAKTTYHIEYSPTPVPVASLSPASLAFPIQLVGSTSAVEPVALTNTGNAPLAIASISLSGADSSDFGLTHNCPASLASGASCSLSPTFGPSASGPRKTLLSISDNAAGSPHEVILTGVGTTVGRVPSALNFLTQAVGTTSVPQLITVTNEGSVTLHLWQVALGGANAGDFGLSNACGGTLAAGASCTVSVTFNPTAMGTRTASVLFSDDGGGSPQAVGLTGTGTTAAQNPVRIRRVKR
ncbi:MAG: choice-of-anchor D domain-containing protein, partial [Terriglobia bacterium]